MQTDSVLYDYVIVGAGPAGCLLANRLSQNPSHRVLLLEAGGQDNYAWIHVPVGYLYCIGNPRTDWCFKTEAEPGLNGRALSYPRGKVLGGCSSINGMIYMRGQSRDYDEWEAQGNKGWAGRTYYRFSSARKATTPAIPTCTAAKANGASSSSGCRGPCSMRFVKPLHRQALLRFQTSTAATMKVAATFRSISDAACAGMRRKHFCVRWLSGRT